MTRRFARFYFDEFIRDYPEVYANDAAFAAWWRMLVAAERAWPAHAEVPRSVSRKVLSVLCEAGLVELEGDRFRLRGWEDERRRRAESGRKGASERWSG